MSQIELKVNYILVMILLLQIGLCFIIAILNGTFINANSSKMDYILPSPYSAGTDSVLIFCTYIVLINTMIPISLIVSM